ncbi:MAG: hypothetical protein H7070_15255 [Saprospiraceae bacterium]|nr:hypothetical protein [Pyrinomonadaceae bacterium]
MPLLFLLNFSQLSGGRIWPIAIRVLKQTAKQQPKVYDAAISTIFSQF